MNYELDFMNWNCHSPNQHSSDKQQSLNFVLTGHAFHSCPAQFSRHFVPIVIHPPIGTLISSIYSVPIKNCLEETFDFLRQTFSKIHWNLHHVSSIVTGLLLLEGKAHRACRRRNKTNKSRWSSDCSATKSRGSLSIDWPTGKVRLPRSSSSHVSLSRVDRAHFQEFLSKTVLSNFCSELDFDVSSSTASDPTTKHVKFRAGLTDERTAVSSLDGPVVSFGKIIGIPKLKDLSKMPEAEGVFDTLIRSTYFTKHIVCAAQRVHEQQRTRRRIASRSRTAIKWPAHFARANRIWLSVDTWTWPFFLARCGTSPTSCASSPFLRTATLSSARISSASVDKISFSSPRRSPISSSATRTAPFPCSTTTNPSGSAFASVVSPPIPTTVRYSGN